MSQELFQIETLAKIASEGGNARRLNLPRTDVPPFRFKDMTDAWLTGWDEVDREKKDES